ncbi:hypothetical protein CLAFUW4_09337 [Fulvia fulva]|uniref:Uncharacterized protein n=1 Tax=Passalora fulva TaxID=5499 RepID=A0A9Q8PF79_PASFU|nr:uncharacterized protein CLAFUR5_09437 [Fulvia fulva]KAK4613496.1 hypothetical protein CLAFUR4_09343 [Fulvia fulva]KAK4614779.1 hypothetical protein CLAFUR0_09335 [Fulvia fulva]UJO21494.1 hypothetical protein CLAFUR5_09437 [Fulvia fulva]WPV20323.1 hypothetical protein CLAFUW4_09337 [Fulvia fulva]WPV35621.1 hypothetical protein CLAFUW7_09338 [Fulvia fulva]
METTDPRDRIFAVLELFRAGAKLNDIPDLLKPDYSKTAGAVFRDATRYALGEANSNTLLATISHRSNEELADNDFASWSLRWDRQYDPEQEAMQLGWAGAGLPQSASANDRRLVPNQVDDLSCLRLKARIIGEVNWCTNMIERRLLDYHVSQNIESVLARAEGVAYQQTFGVDDAVALSATTLTTGSLGDSHHRFENTDQRRFAFVQHLQYLKVHNTAPPLLLTETDPVSSNAPARFHRLLSSRAHRRRYFQLDTGYLGIGPEVLQIGDKLIVCTGAEHLYLLQLVGRAGTDFGSARDLGRHPLVSVQNSRCDKTGLPGPNIPLPSSRLPDQWITLVIMHVVDL